MKLMPTRVQASDLIKGRILNGKTYEQVADEIGITKPTLYTRLVKHNWKKSELTQIREL